MSGNDILAEDWSTSPPYVASSPPSPPGFRASAPRPPFPPLGFAGLAGLAGSAPPPPPPLPEIAASSPIFSSPIYLMKPPAPGFPLRIPPPPPEFLAPIPQQIFLAPPTPPRQQCSWHQSIQ